MQGSGGTDCCREGEVRGLSEGKFSQSRERAHWTTKQRKVFHRGVLKAATKYNEMSKRMEEELTKMTRGQASEPTLSKELATFAESCYVPIFRTVAYFQ